ncbi:chitobiase/beta-hexosaminidase C-terminal domain-containing protein [Flexithrix dorotheae]|uniref:chitobiase/beta-hexosaminidase C-terminal domain-containing protein n=1 Tax=Flexithrix dorotheae TaxID=70993 RepID=UPI000A01EA54
MWMGGAENGNYGPILEFSKGSIFTPADDSLHVIADAFVMEAFPDSVNGTAADMHVLKKEGDNREMYLKFDISDKNKLAGDVELKLYIAQHNSGVEEEEYFIEILPAGNAWTEDTLNWNNRTLPEENVLLEANVDNFNSGMYHYLSSDELTYYVNTAILEGNQDSLTFLVRARDAKTGRLWSAGKEWKNESWLIFKYSTPAPIQKIGVIDDAYVAEATPDDNFGAEADMHIIKEADAEKEVYLRFDLSEVRAGEAVNASLDIYIGQHNSGAGLENYYVDVVGVKNTWSEDSLTWNNKPETDTDPLVMGNVKNFGGGEYRLWTSEAFTSYVNNAIKNKSNYLSLVVRGSDETPGNRLWTAGKEWKNSASLVLSYDPVVATPKVTPEEGDYIDSINVKLSSTTDGAMIYYTLDGTEPSDTSMMYDPEMGIPLMVTDFDSTFTLKALGMADGLNPSLVVTKNFNLSPVSVPIFSPNPLVEYTDEVTVTLSAEPSSALIFYSDVEGEEPTTPYPAEGIIVSSTTTIKAVAVNTSGKFTSAAAEATYKVVNTVAGTGTGPGGVGAADNTISGQPENTLWLKADGITANDGDEVLNWEDASGNENHAYNTFEEGGDNTIPNTIESQKPAPTFVTNGLNGLPILDFGKTEDGDARLRTLMIDDSDNLDGGAGISIFMVFKRNEMLADFAAIFQKRNLSSGADQQAFVVEFDGGSNPHRLQFVLARDLFLKQNVDEVNDQDYYIINVEVQSDFQQALFRTNGELLSTQTYKNIIQSVDAPAILGGFQPMNIAEVIMYKKGLNAAQNKIVHNYLASKWGLELAEGIVYNDSTYTSDIVGVGKETYIDGTTEQEHKSASGGGLMLEMTNTFAAGNFVFAGHNGVGVTNAEAWERIWNVDPSAEGLNVKLGFDFEAVGLTAPTSADGYKLWKDTGDGFEDTGLTGTLDGNVISFSVEGISAGVYGIGKSKPSAIAAPKFSIPGGEYDTEQTVEMTTTTDGAKIFYTTDGSTPTSESTEYTGAITISETTELKAVAILDGESSGVTVATYTIGATGFDYNDISNALIVYPNPASELVKIHFENKDLGAVQLRLMDYSGKTLMQSKAEKQTEVLEFTLPMNKLTNGLYFVEIIQGTQRAVKHIIKQ